MVSPLADYYNTVLIISNNDGIVAQDDDGNWVTTGETTTEYKVYLKKPTDDPYGVYNPGADTASQYLKGYLVEPLELPAHILLPYKTPCRRLVGTQWRDGIFEILPALVPIRLVEQIIGQAIEGRLWFEL